MIRTICVAIFLNTTVAPGIEPLEGSVTIPETAAPIICASRVVLLMTAQRNPRSNANERCSWRMSATIFRPRKLRNYNFPASKQAGVNRKCSRAKKAQRSGYDANENSHPPDLRRVQTVYGNRQQRCSDAAHSRQNAAYGSEEAGQQRQTARHSN